MMRSFILLLLFIGAIRTYANTERSFGFVAQNKDSLLLKIQTLATQDNPYVAKWIADENNIIDEKLNWMISSPKNPWIDSTNAQDYIDWKGKIKKIKKPAAKKKYIDSLAALQPKSTNEQYLFALQVAENAYLFKKKIKPEELLDALQKEDKTGFEKLNCLLVALRGYTHLKNKKKLIEIENAIEEIKAKYATQELAYYKTALKEQRANAEAAAAKKIVPVEKINDKPNIFLYLFIAALVLAIGIVLYSLMKKNQETRSRAQQNSESEKRWQEKEKIHNDKLLNTQQQLLELKSQIESLKAEIIQLKNQNNLFQSKLLEEFDHHMAKVKERFEDVKKNAGVGEVMSLQNDLTRMLAWRASLTK